MVVEAQDFLFPLAAAFVFVGLAAGLTRRRRVLGGADADFMAALLLSGAALLGAPVAAARGWDPAGEALVAAGASGALLATAGASLHAYGVRMRRLFGERGLRWTLLTGSVALLAFGWGAGSTGPAAGGPGAPSPWPVIAVAAVSVATVGLVGAVSIFVRAPVLTRAQLVLGIAGLAVGFVGLAAGSPPVAGAVGMVGGGFLYSAVRGPDRPAEGPQEPGPPPRGGDRRRADSGVKVRIPKGTAQRVTRFRDDGLPPGGP